MAVDKLRGYPLLRRLLSAFVLVALLLGVLPLSVLAAPAQAGERAPQAHYTYYTVQPGDSLGKIALRYGTTISALMSANGIANPNHIYVGQKLRIPTGGAYCVRYHTVSYGETLSTIAVWYGVSTYSLAQANNITNYNRVYVGQSLCIPGGSAPEPSPPAGGFWYKVTYGDTLSRIALRYGTTVYAIMAANNLASAHRILVGQSLWIPSGYAPPPPPPGPKPTPPPTTVTPTYGGPWTALYYNNKDLSGTPVDTRVDGKIHFDWGAGSPSAAVNSDGFSALWTAVNTFDAGTYKFTATSDDGVRVYVDGNLVIDGWKVHPATEYNGEIALSAGSHTVQVRYFEDTGMASIHVRWAKK